MENEAIKKKIALMYPEIYDIPESDVEAYIEYCDQAPYNAKHYQSFKNFRELKEKCRKKGLESILFRKDVMSVTKGHYKEGWGGPHDVEYDYILVNTDYGSFRYTKGGLII